MSTLYTGNFIHEKKHSPTEEAVLLALDRFGCLSIEQIPYFVPPYTSINDKYISSICRHLLLTRQANFINNEYLVPYKVNEVDESIILSIWTFIDLLKDNDKIYSFYRNCPAPKYPCNACYIKDNAVLCSIIPILTPSDLSKILIENEKFASYDPNSGLKREYVLAVKDLYVIDDLPNFQPQFPIKIAHVEGDLKTRPKVTYYSIS